MSQSNDVLNSQGADCLAPEPNSEVNPNPNRNPEASADANGDAQPATAAAVAVPLPKAPVSAARLRANRENSKKSPGPKTARGKAHSRRNSFKHGLTSKVIFHDSYAEPINKGLSDLRLALLEKYGDGDVRTAILVETVTVEWFRQNVALEHEMDCYLHLKGHFSAEGDIPNLQRYRTASQRSLFKSLELLDEQGTAAEENDAEDEGEIQSSPSNLKTTTVAHCNRVLPPSPATTPTSRSPNWTRRPQTSWTERLFNRMVWVATVTQTLSVRGLHQLNPNSIPRFLCWILHIGRSMRVRRTRSIFAVSHRSPFDRTAHALVFRHPPPALSLWEMLVENGHHFASQTAVANFSDGRFGFYLPSEDTVQISNLYFCPKQ